MGRDNTVSYLRKEIVRLRNQYVDGLVHLMDYITKLRRERDYFRTQFERLLAQQKEARDDEGGGKVPDETSVRDKEGSEVVPADDVEKGEV